MKPSISINPTTPELTRELFQEMSEAGFGAVDFGCFVLGLEVGNYFAKQVQGE